MESNLFNMWRITSQRHPSQRSGLPVSLTGKGSTRYISLRQLKALTADAIGFYRLDLIEPRGEQCLSERFVLEASLNGHNWVFIKDFEPNPGSGSRLPDPPHTGGITGVLQA